MSLPIGPTPRPGYGTPPPSSAGEILREQAQGHASAALKAAFQVDLAELVTASPPIELQREVQFAAQRAAQLAADDRELHFTVDDRTGKVVVQVRDLDGGVIRTIPGSTALDVLAGLEDL